MSIDSFWFLDILPLLDSSDFTPGWFYGYKRDSSDTEWSAFKTLALDHLLFILGYISLSQLVLQLSPSSSKLRPLFVSLSGAVFVMTVLNLKSALFLMLIIVIHVIVSNLHQPILHYVLFVITVYNHRSQFIKDIVFGPFFHFTSDKVILFEVSITWISAKCLSFSIDRIRRWDLNTMSRMKDHSSSNGSALMSHKNSDLVDIFAYCLYLPTLFTGPLHKFNSFQRDVHQSPNARNNRHETFLLHSIRFITWAIMFDILLHFLYANAIQFYPHLVTGQYPFHDHSPFDGWSFVGLGYTLCCLFYLKYLPLFGIPGVISSYEGIHLPPPPQCVTRNHSSSMLWRHFDRGLYEWLTEYFYIPLMEIDKRSSNSASEVIHSQTTDFKTDNPKRRDTTSSRRKIFAAGASFTVVCLWHNLEKAAIVWCGINFGTVCLESCIDSWLGKWPVSESMGNNGTERTGAEKRKTRKGLFCKASLIGADSKEDARIVDKGKLRIRALISAPLFALMIISNLYFLANYELGNAFVQRIFLSFLSLLFPFLSSHPIRSSLIPFIPTMIVMYSGSYVSLSLVHRMKESERE